MDIEATIIYGFEVNLKEEEDKELLEYARTYSDDTIYFADIYESADDDYEYIGNAIDGTSDGIDIGYLLKKEFGGEDINSFLIGRYKDFFKEIKNKFGKEPSLYLIIQ